MKFKLKDIAPFDARRGYKAHPYRGVSTIHEKRKATADYWSDHNGNLVIRIYSGEYKHHFAATLASGKQIPDNKIDEFGEWIAVRMAWWLCDGELDYVPDYFYDE